MRNNNFRTKVAEALSETPLVAYACKKVGISRATFYRWRKDNLEFRKQVDEVLKNGRAYVSELCEASMIKEIKNGNLSAIKFWLQNNDPRYRPIRPYYMPPVDKRVLRPGQTCNQCGTTVPGGTFIMDDDIKRIEETFGFKRVKEEEKDQLIQTEKINDVSKKRITLSKNYLDKLNKQPPVK